MKNVIGTLTIICVVIGLVLGVISGFSVNDLQLETLKVLGIITLCSIAYCFLVGEISRNNSQMDKLWSILPIAYAWVVVAKGGFSIRLIVMAILITLWGARLTANFARKGAYSIKFWTGEEDYRWPILRKTKIFSNKIAWALFDLLFISAFQNILVLAICFPMVACMTSTTPFGVFDIIVSLVALFFIVYETIADEQQMKFQTKKWKMINEGKKLEELPEPYNKGFNTVGLWSRSRHPNYCAEQAFWITLYVYCITSNVTTLGIINWTIIGAAVLVLLFLGSSIFGENISSKKYPEYKEYKKRVWKYLPFVKY